MELESKILCSKAGLGTDTLKVEASPQWCLCEQGQPASAAPAGGRNSELQEKFC